jgi:hypothetical protein
MRECLAQGSGRFAQADHGPTCERCRNLNLDGVSGEVCRENPEALPPLFYLYFCLVLRMTEARILMDGAYAYLAACYKLTTDHCIVDLNCSPSPGAWLKASCLVGCFY